MSCGSGKVATGGGFSGSASGQIHTSAPTGSPPPTGWTVSGKNTSGTVYAICTQS
ncbi:hypothetical protein GCM10022252_46670 [Streptosporangium oxazolinicum]|uniref:Uncharacterized protein n=1 Tax=Streptosporangium oxazolinicum TaxID=909287 RepID=A0ABP8B443_9ACTN